MKIKDYKCHQCGHDDFFFKDKCDKVGIYCSYCGRWNKWANKNERNLAMKVSSSAQYGLCVSHETEKSNTFFGLENWVLDLLKDIQTASEKGENYDLHLEPAIVKEIAEAYKRTERIEIY